MAQSIAEKWLQTTVQCWFVVAIAGLWAFCLSLLTFYGGPLITGNIEAWNSHPFLTNPPVIVDAPASTAAFGFHALGAGIISLIGAFQFIPYIRRKAPGFHRWIGRVFVALVVTLSLSGFYLVWIRGPVPESIGGLSTSVNGLLILSFAVLTVSYAVKKQFAVHQQWALRLFLVANAQWFFRIGAFGYFMAGRAIGNEVSLDDNFFNFWNWGCFAVPLAIAQMYFWARKTDIKVLRGVTVGVLAMTTVGTLWGAGVFSMVLLSLARGTLVI